jgi:hypothetical protein
MPLRVAARATVTSVAAPATITAALSREQAPLVRVGQPAVTKIAGQRPTGKVVRVSGETVDIEFPESLPANTAVGTQVSAWIEYSKTENTLFVERPVTAREDSEGSLFRVDPGATSATRVRVRYGVASGDLIEIREGLKAGDDVIVSEPGSWAEQARVRLE